MKRILNAEEMRRADQAAMDLGIPSMVLMERAALSVVEELFAREINLQRVCVVCGTGNNGGDGVAIARILSERGLHPDVYLIGPAEKYSEQMLLQVKIAEKYPITFVKSFCPDEYTVIIDAIFGIGLSRPVTGAYKEVIDRINSGTCPVVSVDIPSGIHTDTGAVMGSAVQADLTVTFARGKLGLYLYPGASYAGNIVIKEIGIPIMEQEPFDPSWVSCPEPADLQRLPDRDESGNKGTFKKVLVIAGSKGMCGAAYLSAKAALMTGIGMVKIYTSEVNRIPLSVLLPEALIDTYREEEWTPELVERELGWADALLIGPGLSQSAFSEELLRTVLEQNTLPCVMDADALNLMAAHPEYWQKLKAPCTITPHMGEMSRLVQIPVGKLKEAPLEAARKFAAAHQVTCVLKDARTVTALPNGSCCLNLSGNSALATAGSGDVLAGILAGLTAQHGNLPIPVSALAVYIHGLCGESASKKYSKASVTAETLLEALTEYL